MARRALVTGATGFIGGRLAAFLAGQIGFLEIAAIVSDILDRYDPPAPATLDAVLAIDAEARVIAGEQCQATPVTRVGA